MVWCRSQQGRPCSETYKINGSEAMAFNDMREFLSMLRSMVSSNKSIYP
jgi:hypothetical protein